MLEQALTTALRAACDAKVAPGLACAVILPGTRLNVVCGRHSYDPQSAPITAQSVWDLASLTKVICTFHCYQTLAREGVITAKTQLGDLLECAGFPDKAALLITDLLAHRAGFSGAIDYFKDHTDRAALEDAVMRTPLTFPAGGKRVYDDASYILLGLALAQHFAKDLATVFQDMVFTPLGMDMAGFNPAPAARAGAVPTEWVSALSAVAQGIVHDDNTRILGGVAGHAGLFATLPDLTTYCEAWLDSASTPQILAPQDYRYEDETGAYTIGWDIFNPRTMPPRAAVGWYSHTGFTGTMLSVSAQHNAAVILLSNRVFPARGDNAQINALRRQVLDLVIDEIERD